MLYLCYYYGFLVLIEKRKKKNIKSTCFYNNNNNDTRDKKQYNICRSHNIVQHRRHLPTYVSILHMAGCSLAWESAKIITVTCRPQTDLRRLLRLGTRRNGSRTHIVLNLSRISAAGQGCPLQVPGATCPVIYYIIYI